MKVLLLGSRGMLGQAVVAAHTQYAADNMTLVPVECDVTDCASLRSIERELKPEAVINCAGVIPLKVRSAYQAAMVNASAPHLIAAIFQDAHVVHISTDCVFSGRDMRSHTTNDLPDPVDVYGCTKRAGELLSEPNATTVRTSFIGHKHGLLPWFLEQTGEVHGWANALWSGSTVQDVAGWLPLIARGQPRGVIHLAAPAVSKYEVLLALQDAFNKRDVMIVPKETPHVYRNLAPTIQMRPFCEALKELVK